MAFNDTIIAAYASASNLSLFPYSDNLPIVIESSGSGETLLTTASSTLITLIQTTKNLTLPSTHLIQTTSYPFVANSSSLLSTIFSSLPLTSIVSPTSLSTNQSTTSTTTFTRSTASATVSYLPVVVATSSTTLSHRYKTITSSSSTYIPTENDYFLFKTKFHRIIRIVELFILSLTLP
ncbi:unnamed protein product, partial [Didymodactylos carnosus]